MISAPAASDVSSRPSTRENASPASRVSAIAPRKAGKQMAAVPSAPLPSCAAAAAAAPAAIRASRKNPDSPSSASVIGRPGRPSGMVSVAASPPASRKMSASRMPSAHNPRLPDAAMRRCMTALAAPRPSSAAATTDRPASTAALMTAAPRSIRRAGMVAQPQDRRIAGCAGSGDAPADRGAARSDRRAGPLGSRHGAAGSTHRSSWRRRKIPNSRRFCSGPDRPVHRRNGR